MQNYEVMFIIRPDLEEEATKAVVDRMSEVVRTAGGSDLKVEAMGKRRLAYEVRKFKDGYYVLMNFAGEAAVPAELERIMKISDSVIRFLTTRAE
ncbi:MAG: 30S ribosomal protein S6 [Gracilibacteraceae bacterium]|jgi:small subunit ribosomal protein S6|nr:30S ribosomal protein S6 [Gracilibacteraceae bacterium]